MSILASCRIVLSNTSQSVCLSHVCVFVSIRLPSFLQLCLYVYCISVCSAIICSSLSVQRADSLSVYARAFIVHSLHIHCIFATHSLRIRACICNTCGAYPRHPLNAYAPSRLWRLSVARTCTLCIWLQDIPITLFNWIS